MNEFFLLCIFDCHEQHQALSRRFSHIIKVSHLNSATFTLKILSFRTERSGQTVQTQIRLLRESSLIRVFTVCYSISTILTKYPFKRKNGHRTPIYISVDPPPQVKKWCLKNTHLSCLKTKPNSKKKRGIGPLYISQWTHYPRSKTVL